MEKKIIYADNAATTNISAEVLNAMMPYLTENFGNPSSIHSAGRCAKKALEESRANIADAINAVPKEIFFTSGGTESDNWAVISAAQMLAPKGKKHIVTTAFEHHAVLHTCAYLEKLGYEVTYLPVNEKGFVTVSQVRDSIRGDTALVSVMTANNEIGTVQPIAEIGEVCRERGVLFHTDAVQAVGNIHIDVKQLNIDMMSVSGHKIHAQKGTGFLYVRAGTDIMGFIHGGAQERGLRAGTENVPAIVGLAKAVGLAVKDIPERTAALARKRDRLIRGLSEIEYSRLNGSSENRLAGNVNMSFLGTESESLLLMLDMKGICASGGSACTSASLDPSHVLLALGLPREAAESSLRLTISDDITDSDIEYIISAVRDSVGQIRSMSPYWKRIAEGDPYFDNVKKYFGELKQSK